MLNELELNLTYPAYCVNSYSSLGSMALISKPAYWQNFQIQCVGWQTNIQLKRSVMHSICQSSKAIFLYNFGCLMFSFAYWTEIRVKLNLPIEYFIYIYSVTKTYIDAHKGRKYSLWQTGPESVKYAPAIFSWDPKHVLPPKVQIFSKFIGPLWWRPFCIKL